MQNKYIYIFFLLCCYTQIPLNAELKFKNQHLEKIYHLIQKKATNIEFIKRNKSLNDISLIYNLKYEQCNFEIRLDTLISEVQHIGLNLFPEYYDTIYNPIILRFVERELLYYLLDDKDNIKAKLEQNKLVIKFNKEYYGTEVFNNISDIIPVLTMGKNIIIINLNYDNTAYSFYEIRWTDEKQNLVEFRFPARIDIISGFDKVELENELNNKLSSLKDKIPNNISFLPDWNNIIKFSDSLFLYKRYKDFFDFNSNIYYFRRQMGYEFVSGLNFKKEILSNNIQLAQFDNNTNINIMQHCFGNITKEILIGINDFIINFYNDHRIYVGFEEEEDSLSITALFVNFYFNYLHMVFIKVSKDLLNKQENMSLKGDMYSFIRLDNIEDIFSEYKNGKGNFRFKLRQ